MTRIRSLNGLPNELTQKYISSLMYFDRGYMLDWISKRLKEANIDSAEIDIFKETSEPNNFIIKPIRVYFGELKSHIFKRLNQNGFDSDFITEAKFQVSITDMDKAYGTVSIKCTLTSRESRQFIGKMYSDKTYPIADTFLERILNKK